MMTISFNSESIHRIKFHSLRAVSTHRNCKRRGPLKGLLGIALARLILLFVSFASCQFPILWKLLGAADSDSKWQSFFFWDWMKSPYIFGYLWFQGIVLECSSWIQLTSAWWYIPALCMFGSVENYTLYSNGRIASCSDCCSTSQNYYQGRPQ